MHKIGTYKHSEKTKRKIGLANSKKVKLICKNCNKEFLVSPSRKNRIKYCSFTCYRISLVGKPSLTKGIKRPEFSGKKHPRWVEKDKINCKYCNKEFITSKCRIENNKGKFCSKNCFFQYNKGKNNYKWKGGISPLHEIIRALPESRYWKLNIFQRDNFTCIECGKKDKTIEAHHLKRFFLILKEFLQIYSQFSPIEDKETLARLAITYQPFWDLDNGKTLCEDCHNLTKKGVSK